MLREYFPQGRPITKDTVNAWHAILKDYDYRVMCEAAKEVAREGTISIMPPPGVLIKKVEALGADTNIELWNEAEKLICKGTVLTVEEFRQASPEIQRYFGNLRRIRDLALMPPQETSNERARFLREVPKIRESIRIRKSLPPDVLAIIDGAAERKQIT